MKIAELQLGKAELCNELGEALYKRLFGAAAVVLTVSEAQQLISFFGAENAFAVMDFGRDLILAVKAYRAVFG